MAAKHQEDQAAMKEQILDIPTKDGAIETFVCHPERGGPCPPVLFLMDAPGIRDELYDMARRLATVGYYVLQYGDRRIWGATAGMLVNLYRMLA